MIYYESGVIKKWSLKFFVKKFGIIFKVFNVILCKNWKFFGKEYIVVVLGFKIIVVINVIVFVDLDFDINDKNDLSVNLEFFIEFVNVLIDYGIE